MPTLDEITYSRQEVIDEVRDFYKFLIQLYLPEHILKEPPEGGWPHITPENCRFLGKTDEVIMLLRHLPYLHPDGSDGFFSANGAPVTDFADWDRMLEGSLQKTWKPGEIDEESRVVTEGWLFEEDSVPPHVIGLTCGGRDKQFFLLDTEQGVIYWIECRYEIKGFVPWETSPEGVRDDPWDYIDNDKEGEIVWRKDSGAWAVKGFFVILKEQFRKLNLYPRGKGQVEEIWAPRTPDDERREEQIRETFRAHGWPDLEKYRKQECIEAVVQLVERTI